MARKKKNKFGIDYNDFYPQDAGKWIMIIRVLPISADVRPPKLSIHWSTAWAESDMTNSLIDRLLWEYTEGGKYDQNTLAAFKDELDYTSPTLCTIHGREQNWLGARAIIYKGEKIRVFPNEYSVVDAHMDEYTLGVDGDEPSHILIPGDASQELLLKGVLDTDQKLLKEYALLEGATEAQAIAAALGIDFSEHPPIGWYRIKPQYGLIYADADELQLEEWELPSNVDIGGCNGN